MKEEIKKSLEVLRSGGIILYPTDTVWGLGCDATNEDAVKRIIDLLKPCDSNELIVLIDSVAKLETYIEDVPEMAWDLIEFSQKPLTIIYSYPKSLAKSLISSDKSVGIRITNEMFSKQLCSQFRKPIAFIPAVNGGELTQFNFSNISNGIKDAVDYIVGFRQDDKSMSTASSIIKLGRGSVFQIIRE